jgi:hypothetical protein
MKLFRNIGIFLLLLGLAFIIFRGYQVDIFYHPDQLVTAYVDSIFDADIRKSKFLQTAKQDAVDEFFGVLTTPILAAYRKAQRISRDEVSFTSRVKNEYPNKRVYEITFRKLDIKFLLDKVDEYKGYIQNIDGQLVDVPGKYPALSFEAAAKLVRQNEKIPFFTKILSLEVIRKNDKWLIGNADEIWYYLHPDLEQYRKIISK